MRTTLTLDPDVAMLLKRRMEEQHLSLKETVNEVMRAGFNIVRKKPQPRFRVRTVALNFRPGIDTSRLNHLADELEDQEILRKLHK